MDHGLTELVTIKNASDVAQGTYASIAAAIAALPATPTGYTIALSAEHLSKPMPYIFHRACTSSVWVPIRLQFCPPCGVDGVFNPDAFAIQARSSDLVNEAQAFQVLPLMGIIARSWAA